VLELAGWFTTCFGKERYASSDEPKAQKAIKPDAFCHIHQVVEIE